MIPEIPDLPEFTACMYRQPDAPPWKVWGFVLNNFHLNYPRRAHTEKKERHPACPGYYRKLSIKLRRMDDKMSLHEKSDRYTEKRLNMTDREYFAELDVAAKACGFYKRTVAEAGMIRGFKLNRDHSWIEVFGPIYIHLREQGLNNADLTT